MKGINLAIVTHPRIYNPPTPPAQALEQVSAWLEAPSLVLLAESSGYWEQLRSLVDESRVNALCLQHGVKELWTADRDFSRFAPLSTRNPLVAV